MIHKPLAKLCEIWKMRFVTHLITTTKHMDTTTPSFEQVKEALAGRVIALAIFSNETLGIAPRAFLAFDPPTWPLPPSMLDVSALPLAKRLRALYDYAYHATLGAKTAEPDDLDDGANEYLRDFLDAVSDRNGLLEDILANLQWSFDAPAQWTLIDQLIELHYARSTLDQGGSLTVEEVALLAGMSERSVRNALSIEGPAGLVGKRTESPTGERRTVIENAEARRWLAGRRGFRPTKRAWVPDTPDQLPNRITTRAELTAFIRQRVDVLHGSVEAAATATKVEPTWVGAALNGDFELTETNIEALARLTNVDEAWLAEQVLRVRLPRAFDAMTARFGTPNSLDA